MISVVIPVYNESRSVVQLIKILQQINYIQEIIVVDDGSTDKTSEIIRNLPIKLISKSVNQGKDLAVLSGAQVAQNEWLLLLDGDLVGLTAGHIDALYAHKDSHDMVLGILRPLRIVSWLFFINRYYLTRTGLRLVRRDEIINIPQSSLGQFRLESILSSIARENKWLVKKVVLANIRHIIKEKKGGLKWGIVLRAKMIFDIASFYGEKLFRS